MQQINPFSHSIWVGVGFLLGLFCSMECWVNVVVGFVWKFALFVCDVSVYKRRFSCSYSSFRVLPCLGRRRNRILLLWCI